MNRQVLEAMCQVCQRLDRLKAVFRGDIGLTPSEKYKVVREAVNDCYVTMASLADCSPDMLIKGKVDAILNNLSSPWQLGKPKEPGWYLLEFTDGDRFLVVRAFHDEENVFRMEDQCSFGHIDDIVDEVVRHLPIPPL